MHLSHIKPLYLIGILAITFAVIVIFSFSPFKNDASENIDLTIAKSPAAYAKLDDTLYLLTKAKNRDNFAKQYSLTIKANQVQVSIELNDKNYSISSVYGNEITRVDNFLDAQINIDKLLELSEKPEIKTITLPTKAIPLN